MNFNSLFIYAITALTIIFTNQTRCSQIKVKQNQTLSLHCNVSNPEPTSIITFKKDGIVLSINNVLEKQLQSQYRIKSNANHKQYDLEILNAQKNHSGVYRCESFGSNASFATFDVIVLVPPSIPRITTTNNKTDLMAGSDVEFECLANEIGNPAARTTWLIKSANSLFVKMAEGRTMNLTLNSGHNLDLIKCALHNEAVDSAVESSEFLLDVKYCPALSLFANGSLVNSTFPLDVLAGNSLMLSCVAHSNPTVDRYVWTRPQSLINSDDIQNRHLILRNVSKHDSGVFSCEAFSPMCSQKTSLDLNVLYPPQVRILERNSVPIVVNQSDYLMLNCCIRSNPATTEVVWLLDRVALSNSTLVNKNSNDDDEICSNLILYPIAESHTGRFTCQASNWIGKSAMAVNGPRTETIRYFGEDHVDVVVQVAPSRALYNHSTNQLKELISAKLGNSVTLSCTMKGFPLPAITWIKDKTTLRSSSCDAFGSHMLTCKLTINKMSPSDYGNYSCLASNPLGIASSSYEITAKTAPQPPRNLSVLDGSIGYSWAYICWQPAAPDQRAGGDHGNNDNDVESYIIDVNFPHWQVRTKDTCMNLTGLSESSQYRIRVLALNNVGRSAWTNRLRFATTAYPLKSKDLPKLINPLFKPELKILQFDLSPFRKTLISTNQMCVQLSGGPSSPAQQRPYHHRCLPIRNGYYVSIRNYDLGDKDELFVNICSLEKRSLCGPETIVDLQVSSNRFSLWILIVLATTLVLLAVVVTLAGLSLRKFPRSKNPANNILKIGEKNNKNTQINNIPIKLAINNLRNESRTTRPPKTPVAIML